MRTSILAAAALATITAPLVSAGYARVYNNCPQTLYLHSVGPEGIIRGPVALAPASASEDYSEKFIAHGGRALKVTSTAEGLYTAAPTLNFAYTIDDNGSLVWYDLSTVYGDLVPGSAVRVDASDETCRDIVWADGKYPGSQVNVCGSKTDLVLTLCA